MNARTIAAPIAFVDPNVDCWIRFSPSLVGVSDSPVVRVSSVKQLLRNRSLRHGPWVVRSVLGWLPIVRLVVAADPNRPTEHELQPTVVIIGDGLAPHELRRLCALGAQTSTGDAGLDHELRAYDRACLLHRIEIDLEREAMSAYSSPAAPPRVRKVSR